MEEFKKHGKVGRAALRADMDRKTARKYLAADKLPSELKEPRTWRTRADPFEEAWPYVLEMLEDAPDLEAVALFEHLVECQPGKYQVLPSTLSQAFATTLFQDKLFEPA